MNNTVGRVPIKVRWRLWRARFSVPVLLGRFSERKVVSMVAGVNGGLTILTIGFLAWLTDLPLVFPALGPSTFILFSTPMTPGAAPRSVIGGHLICLAIGCGVWHLMSYLSGSPVSIEAGGWPVFCGASLTLGGCCLMLVLLSCPHPPSCASGLVVVLGGVTAWGDLLLMALVVVWLAMQAVGMNRLAGLPVPLWYPRRQLD